MDNSKQQPMELITLQDFIFQIDKVFPLSFDRESMQELVISKYKDIVSYARFLDQRLTIEMFEGENRIFKGGEYVDIQPSINWNYYRIADSKVFIDSNTQVNASIGKKVSDIAGKGIMMTKNFKDV